MHPSLPTRLRVAGLVAIVNETFHIGNRELDKSEKTIEDLKTALIGFPHQLKDDSIWSVLSVPTRVDCLWNDRLKEILTEAGWKQSFGNEFSDFSHADLQGAIHVIDSGGTKVLNADYGDSQEALNSAIQRLEDEHQMGIRILLREAKESGLDLCEFLETGGVVDGAGDPIEAAKFVACHRNEVETFLSRFSEAYVDQIHDIEDKLKSL